MSEKNRRPLVSGRRLVSTPGGSRSAAARQTVITLQGGRRPTRQAVIPYRSEGSPSQQPTGPPPAPEWERYTSQNQRPTSPQYRLPTEIRGRVP